MMRLKNTKNIKHLVYGISTVKDGNMAFKYGEKDSVIQNRTLFLNKLGLPLKNYTCMGVEHKTKTIIVDSNHKGLGTKSPDNTVIADALVTKELNHGLFLSVADCFPTIIFDRKNKILALVHLGWKNTNLKLATKVVRLLTHKLGSISDDLIAIVGPGTGKASFIYDKNILDQTSDGFKDFLIKKGKNYYIDNLGYILKQLKDSGIHDKNLFYSKIDTITNKNFYSHHRDFHNKVNDQGRFAMACYISE